MSSPSPRFKPTERDISFANIGWGLAHVCWLLVIAVIVVMHRLAGWL